MFIRYQGIVAMGRSLNPSSGFTLVEMAVVMVVMGLVMLTVLPALNTVRAANQVALTQSNLRSLMLATAAYVQANGCLPCPANAGANGANFGVAGNASPCAACPAAAIEGIPPFVSLGLPASTAHDGWGHWITMRVDSTLVKPATVVVPPTAAQGLCGDGTNATAHITVSNSASAQNNIAVVFVSHGSTGYGSYFAQALPGNNGQILPFPSNYNTACVSGFPPAVCNSPVTGAATFYDVPSVVSTTNPYDDILAYASRNVLVSMFGTTACTT